MSHTPATPELPALEPGVQLLAADDRSVHALDSLVLDHVLQADGPAYWVDAHGHATTHALGELAPDPRVLERIQVARGFTAFQHYALIETLVRQQASDASLVICPALDGFYREDDCRRDEGQALLLRVLARLAALAREAGVPVLVTRVQADAFAAPIGNTARETIRFEWTSMGPRFETGDFETLVYPRRDGTVQTTLAYWQRILEARQPVHTAPAAGAEASV